MGLRIPTLTRVLVKIRAMGSRMPGAVPAVPVILVEAVPAEVPVTAPAAVLEAVAQVAVMVVPAAAVAVPAAAVAVAVVGRPVVG